MFLKRLSLLMIMFLAGCSVQKPPFSLDKSSFSDLPNWRNDAHAEALEVLVKSCFANNQPTKWGDASENNFAERAVSFMSQSSHDMPELPSKDDWNYLCRRAALVPASDDNTARIFFESFFTPYLVFQDNIPIGKFTGYYVPLLRGSYNKTKEFYSPIYSLPKELKDGEKSKHYGKFHTRKEIDEGALLGKDLEILWLDDKIMNFFMHIQGSGLIIMPDGHVIRLSYAGKNGRPYSSIGKTLISEGKMTLDEMSMTSLREWLIENPDDADRIMQSNESYIFFRKDNIESGATGAQNVPLTPERSLAVDPSYIPFGLPLYLVTDVPMLEDVTVIEPWTRLMIAQDTGGAIKGAIRGDIFFGYGDEAGHQAGYMNAEGYYYILLPNILSNDR